MKANKFLDTVLALPPLPAAPTSTVPKTIHQIWLNPPAPEPYASWMKRFEMLNPDFEYVLWGPAQVDALRSLVGLVNENLYANAAGISVPHAHHQYASDVLRYEVTFLYGGVYLDADFEPLKPLGGLVDEHPGGFVVRGFEPDLLVNGVYAVPPHSSFMAGLIAGLPARVVEFEGWSNTWLSGPQFYTPYGFESGLDVLDAELFLSYNWNELHKVGRVADGAYAVHHWNNQRRKRHMLLKGAADG